MSTGRLRVAMGASTIAIALAAASARALDAHAADASVPASAPRPEDGELDETAAAAANDNADAGGPVPETSNGPAMVRVAGGTFQMGARESDSKARPNEEPAHAVTVKPFLIDRTEVTVGAYRACVAEGKCAAPIKTSATCTYDLGDPELPISCVRWWDAAAFCRARKKRLPREAEWELAARGTTDATYPWGRGGRVSCALAVTLVRDSTSRSCSGNRPARVGTHPAGASPFGALDMSGNVEEWVEDFYAEHLAPMPPRAGASHVLRGGGWLSGPAEARTTSRDWGSSLEAGPNVGFRCARDL